MDVKRFSVSGAKWVVKSDDGRDGEVHFSFSWAPLKPTVLASEILSIAIRQ